MTIIDYESDQVCVSAHVYKDNLGDPRVDEIIVQVLIDGILMDCKVIKHRDRKVLEDHLLKKHQLEMACEGDFQEAWREFK